jgi:hypothetical protein
VTVGADTLIVRGGSMPRPAVEANIRSVLASYRRNGLCVKVLVDDQEQLVSERLVPHIRICLTTPALLKEAGLEPDLEATNDLGDRYQYTLWLPDGDPGSLVEYLWRAFRGPFPKEEASDGWTTEDLRGLHHPGS